MQIANVRVMDKLLQVPYTSVVSTYTFFSRDNKAVILQAIEFGMEYHVVDTFPFFSVSSPLYVESVLVFHVSEYQLHLTASTTSAPMNQQVLQSANDE
jgi:hypothetical protein